MRLAAAAVAAILALALPLPLPLQAQPAEQVVRRQARQEGEEHRDE